MCAMINSDVFERALSVCVECPEGRNLPSVSLRNAWQKNTLVANDEIHCD